LTGPHSPPRLSPPVCFRPTHPPFLQALASSCAGATSRLPATCEFPSTLPTRGGSTVPVSRPIACALPVPPCFKSCGFPSASDLPVYCYTPLPLVVPRYAPLVVLVEGGGVEPPAHQRLFDVTAAVVGCRSISSVGGYLIPMPVCTIVSGFFLPYIDFVPFVAVSQQPSSPQ
jgi:hypothetical protein